MASTFTVNPGVDEKRNLANSLSFDPGEPLTEEVYYTPNLALQHWTRGQFHVAKYWRNFNDTPIDGPEDGGTGPYWDVNYVPDTEDLLEALKAHFTSA